MHALFALMQINRGSPLQPFTFMPLDAARAATGDEQLDIMELPEEDATFQFVQASSSIPYT